LTDRLHKKVPSQGLKPDSERELHLLCILGFHYAVDSSGSFEGRIERKHSKCAFFRRTPFQNLRCLTEPSLNLAMHTIHMHTELKSWPKSIFPGLSSSIAGILRPWQGLYCRIEQIFMRPAVGPYQGL